MKYTITAKCIQYLTLDVDADSLEEAYEIGQNASMNDFTMEDPVYPDFDIYTITDEQGDEYMAEDIEQKEDAR